MKYAVQNVIVVIGAGQIGQASRDGGGGAVGQTRRASQYHQPRHHHAACKR